LCGFPFWGFFGFGFSAYGRIYRFVGSLPFAPPSLPLGLFCIEADVYFFGGGGPLFCRLFCFDVCLRFVYCASTFLHELNGWVGGGLFWVIMGCPPRFFPPVVRLGLWTHPD